MTIRSLITFCSGIALIALATQGHADSYLKPNLNFDGIATSHEEWLDDQDSESDYDTGLMLYGGWTYGGPEYDPNDEGTGGFRLGAGLFGASRAMPGFALMFNVYLGGFFYEEDNADEGGIPYVGSEFLFCVINPDAFVDGTPGWFGGIGVGSLSVFPILDDSSWLTLPLRVGIMWKPGFTVTAGAEWIIPDADLDVDAFGQVSISVGVVFG